MQRHAEHVTGGPVVGAGIVRQSDRVIKEVKRVGRKYGVGEGRLVVTKFGGWGPEQQYVVVSWWQGA